MAGYRVNCLIGRGVLSAGNIGQEDGIDAMTGIEQCQRFVNGGLSGRLLGEYRPEKSGCSQSLFRSTEVVLPTSKKFSSSLPLRLSWQLTDTLKSLGKGKLTRKPLLNGPFPLPKTSRDSRYRTPRLCVVTVAGHRYF